MVLGANRKWGNKMSNTPQDVLTRVQTLLQALVWTGTSNKIFGSNVYVVSEFPMQQIGQLCPPCVVILDQGFTPHKEHSAIGTERFTIMIFVENMGQNMGQGAMLSQNRVTGTSQGAGLLAIEKAVCDMLRTTISDGTNKVCYNMAGRGKKTMVKGNQPLMTSNINCSVFCWDC